MPRRFSVALLLLAASGCALSDHVYETLTVHRPKSGVDVNHAPLDELARLPGIEDEDAERIVRARPFDVKSDLVRRGVVSEAKYAKFQGRIYVGRGSVPDEPEAAAPPRAARAPEEGD